MDSLPSNLLPCDSKKINNNNCNSDGGNDDNPTSELCEQNSDIDSNDFKYDYSDLDEEESNNNSGILDIEKSNFGQGESIVDNYNYSETAKSIPTMQNENINHSNENHKDIHDKQMQENTNGSLKAANKHIQDKKVVAMNDADYAEEDEPIFNFLGKANEIVCYYFQ